MANFVLVHGAWGGSAGYNAVTKLLRAKGHDVYAPSLTGLGDRSHLLHPSIDLSLHIKDIATVIDYEKLGEFVLVGHSYGGMVVTGVSALYGARIRSLVYLDAFLPDDGQSLFDLQPKEGRDNFINQQRDTPGLVPPFFAQGNAALARTVGPHPLLTLTEPVKLTGEEKKIKNRTYVLAAGQSPAPFQRFYDKIKAMNDPSWKLVTMPTGHAVQMEDPQGTAKLLIEELDR
jgi:pimeloyl-ACP methyl ester carboxylesterase